MTASNLLALTKAGYCFEFQAEPSSLFCEFLGLRLTPEEFDVKEVYRFDGDADEENEQMLYLITTSAGVKGTLVMNSHEVFENTMSFEMAVKLRTHPYGEWICS